MEPGARSPGRAGVTLEVVGGLVAKELHAVAALDERETFSDEPLQFDGADFRAVLFLLAALLCVFIVVELALYAVDGAVEEIDGRPEQVVEIGFEARVGERRDQRVEDVGDSAGDGVGFRQRPRIGLVLERAMSMELQLGEDMVGRMMSGRG